MSPTPPHSPDSAFSGTETVSALSAYSAGKDLGRKLFFLLTGDAQGRQELSSPKTGDLVPRDYEGVWGRGGR